MCSWARLSSGFPADHIADAQQVGRPCPHSVLRRSILPDYPQKAVLVQILLSDGEPLYLEKLRDSIHQSITGSARRPLAPRDPNVPRVRDSTCIQPCMQGFHSSASSCDMHGVR